MPGRASLFSHATVFLCLFLPTFSLSCTIPFLAPYATTPLLLPLPELLILLYLVVNLVLGKHETWEGQGQTGSGDRKKGRLL